MATTYGYAVMDGNEAPDQFRFASSCHHTLRAAHAARDRGNREANAHYYVIPWEATRWARERPAPTHPKSL